MEFKECVLFVSDGECSLCDQVKTIIQEIGFDSFVQICSVSDIAEHPLRNDIMIEVQFNNGALPVYLSGNAIGCGTDVLKLFIHYKLVYKRCANCRNFVRFDDDEAECIKCALSNEFVPLMDAELCYAFELNIKQEGESVK